MKTKRLLMRSFLLLLILSLSLQVGLTQTEEFEVATEINQMIDYFKSSDDKADWEMVLALEGLETNIEFSAESLDLTKDSFEEQKATFYGSRIITLIALGENPYEFQGRNLVAELIEMGDEGVFGSIYDQTYSLLALRSAGVKIKPEMVKALVEMQLEDGGFGFGSSDPDSVGMALLVLANHKDVTGVSECIEDALTYLENTQLETGGFSSYGQENSNSIAKVISGLVALGEDPLNSRWIKDGNTIFDALEKFKIGDGGYIWVMEAEPENNMFSFKQVLMAYRDYHLQQTVFEDVRASLQVSLNIEGLSERLLKTQSSLEVAQKGYLTVNDVFQEVLDNNEMAYKVETGSFGSYISSIDGLSAGKFDMGDGWLYLLNSNSGMGIDSDVINYGDELVFYYGAMAPETLIPTVKILPGKIGESEKIEFKITASYQEFDADWNPTDVTIPVEGATLVINDNEYKTDENGVITIKDLPKGEYDYIIHKNQVDSVPGLLRHYGTLNVDKEFTFADDKDISAWAKNVLYEAYELGLIDVDGERVKPLEKITRAEAVSILLRSKDEELDSSLGMDFEDVEKNHKYYFDIATATKLGYINGVSETKFNPEGLVTREELAAMINNAYKFSDAADVSLADFDKVSLWAKKSVEKIVSNKIIVGSNGYFNPKQNTTREMAAAIYLRLFKLNN